MKTTVPTIDLTDAEHAEVTALIRRAIEEDHFPLARRLACCARPWRSSIRQLLQLNGGR